MTDDTEDKVLRPEFGRVRSLRAARENSKTELEKQVEASAKKKEKENDKRRKHNESVSKSFRLGRRNNDPGPAS